MMRFLLKNSIGFRLRAYLVLLVLGTAAPIILLTGIVLDRAASSQTERFPEEVSYGSRALLVGSGSRIAVLRSVMEGSGRSRALAYDSLPAFQSSLAPAQSPRGVVHSVSSAGGVRRIGYEMSDFTGATVGGRIPVDVT